MKKEKKDINQIAKMIVDLATGEKKDKKAEMLPKPVKNDTKKPLRK